MKRLPPVIYKDSKDFREIYMIGSETVEHHGPKDAFSRGSESTANEILSAQKETRLMNERKPLDLTWKQDQMGDPNNMSTWRVL